MKFVSTRGGEKVTGARAVVQGLSANGGLFVPEKFPKITAAELEDMTELGYPARAAKILSKFFDDYDAKELAAACEEAYAKFEGHDPAPLVRLDDGVYILELFHGPTCAFKDMALTLLPYLLRKGCDLCGIKEEVLVLVATSGDTGKAALEGFKDADGVKIAVFYPNDGVSKMQKLQMCTQDGKNVDVAAVKGNFDDCQTAVKEIFASAECAAALKEKNIVLSSANSINFGRLAPQIAYYFSAYADLVSANQIKNGDEIDFTVPTGNFGNILAAYYAKRMGLPIRRLHCASNKNNVLFDFFNKGEYDINREFYKTTSPSMDILISSNLERLVYRIAGNDPEKNVCFMKALAGEGRYEITESMKGQLEDFYGGYASEKETADTIRSVWKEAGYVLDTHTAVADCVYRKYLEETKDGLPAVIVSTASPFKFARSVMAAIDEKYDAMTDFELVDELSGLAKITVPSAVEEIREARVIHDNICEKDEMQKMVEKFLGLL